ncbi:hypothetical protein A4S06_04020 [Erysipelotrichaceae bacterium MTC7]|nr:hypothetical protein A4S06_04020 [Erysipelotrichaceae bacterium MTC7]
MKHQPTISMFVNVDQMIIDTVLQQANHKHFKRNEQIFSIGDHIHDIYVIMEGTMEISSYDMNGNKKLVTVLGEGELFAESVALGKEHITPFEITAKSPLHVIHFSANEVFDFPKPILKNLLMILSTKNTFLTHKLEILNKTTIRERIFEMLNYYHLKTQSYTITIPFNKTQLAEYLSVNRSSLSRELKAMEQEHIFQMHKKSFVLHPNYF